MADGKWNKAPRFRMPKTLNPTKMDVYWREFCDKTNKHLGVETPDKFEYDHFKDTARSSDDDEDDEDSKTGRASTASPSRTGRTGRTGRSGITVRSSARKTSRREELLDTVRRVEKQRMKKQEELERLLEKERARRRMMDEKYFALVKKIEADAARSDSDAHARPKRVQTRFKLGHKVIMHHPHNQRSIKRTARMTSASPTMYGTKSTRKEYLKANKDKRKLPAKLKKWPHY